MPSAAYSAAWFGGKSAGIVVSESAQHDVVIWTRASLLRHLFSARLRPSARTIDSIGGELACWLVELLQDTNASAPATGRRLTESQLRGCASR